MNLPVITAVTAWVPEAIPLAQWTMMESALHASGHAGWDAWVRSWHPDHAHWLEASPGEQIAGTCLANPGLAAPDMTCMVPVETGTDLSGLAAKVAKAIGAARAWDARPVDVVMFCHSSLDEHVSTTIAGRLRAEIGTPCLAFSVSQQHGVTPFTALRLAADLIVAEPEVHTILIVAAEKWCPPFSRICGADIVHGDAAAALLVERTRHETAGLQLLDAATRHVPAHIRRPAAGAADALASTLLSMIDCLLAQHGLHRDEIDTVVGHPAISSLTTAVCERLGRPGTEAPHQDCVHLGAAESFARLAQALRHANHCCTHRILLWGYGMGGFVGTALLKAHSAPTLHQQDDIRCVP
ncbi:3-oxoacyl-[acyl-carrier-protein] synthase III C-terminal domain-containing protein [Paraburkholderia sp. BR10882]|uniref:3-oxoacyl-[acyl-carrier-protein] synthase III C-terminal domain-containing protein n=1 Tax=unclassified Paraburkholderia TaxID=2615204 RepID=UPI0034CE95DC